MHSTSTPEPLSYASTVQAKILQQVPRSIFNGVRVVDGSGKLCQVDRPTSAKDQEQLYGMSRWRATCSRLRSAEWRCVHLDSPCYHFFNQFHIQGNTKMWRSEGGMLHTRGLSYTRICIDSYSVCVTSYEVGLFYSSQANTELADSKLSVVMVDIFGFAVVFSMFLMKTEDHGWFRFSSLQILIMQTAMTENTGEKTAFI